MASPPEVLSMNELQEITGDFSKLTIVHEIVLNSDFKLQAASFSPDRGVCVYICSGSASLCHITENVRMWKGGGFGSDCRSKQKIR